MTAQLRAWQIVLCVLGLVGSNVTLFAQFHKSQFVKAGSNMRKLAYEFASAARKAPFITNPGRYSTAHYFHEARNSASGLVRTLLLENLPVPPVRCVKTC